MQNDHEKFQQYWAQFSAELNLDNKQVEELYSLLINAYTEPQRHYHTFQHIVECLDLFHQIKEQLNDTIAVELAIWFHDVIYDPKAINNEEQSAELMQKSCSNLLASDQIQKVYDWIIATKKHQALTDQDLNYLLDIDLAILGNSTARFAEYEQQIQQEYTWVESDLYKLKRAEVLQYFYQMQPIYQTHYFNHLFEDQAKQNLLKMLSKK